MNLITESQRIELLNNARAAEHCRWIGQAHDPRPVVCLRERGGYGRWLLTALELDNPDYAWGLCDPGTGVPRMGYVRLSDIVAKARLLGVSVECVIDFIADRPISAYAEEARARGLIEV